MSAMDCQGWRSVGVLFPFPERWAGASTVDGDIHGQLFAHELAEGRSLIGVRYPRMSVGRKQLMLGAFEAAVFLGVVRTASVDAVFNNSTRLSLGVRQLDDAARRRQMVESVRPISNENLVVCIPALLQLARVAVSKGVLTYFPPGNNYPGSGLGDCPLFDHGFALATDAGAFRDISDFFGDLSNVTYAGWDDLSVWPTLLPGVDNTVKLAFWSFLADWIAYRVDAPGLNFANRLRGLYRDNKSSPWHPGPGPYDSTVSALAAELWTSLGLTPPPLGSICDRRLATVYFTAFAQTLAKVRSQEIASDRLLQVPHLLVEGSVRVMVSLEFQAGGGPVTATVYGPERDVSESVMLDTMLPNRLEYEWSGSRSELDLSASATSAAYYEAMDIGYLDGRGEPYTDENGVDWIRFTASDYMAAADAHGLERQTKFDSGASGIMEVTAGGSVKYYAPLLDSGSDEYSVRLDGSLAPGGESMPCAAAAWILDSALLGSAIAAGHLSVVDPYGSYPPMGVDADFFCSAKSVDSDSALFDLLAASTYDLVAKVSAAMSGYANAAGPSFFSQRPGASGMIRVRSPEAVAADVQRALADNPVSIDTFVTYRAFRVRADGTAGLQATADGTHWIDPVTDIGGQVGMVKLFSLVQSVSAGNVSWTEFSGAFEAVEHDYMLPLSAYANILHIASTDMSIHHD